MAKRRLPPNPKAPPVAEKFTVWALYRGDWFAIRSFLDMSEASDFAEKVVRVPAHISQDQHTVTITPRVTFPNG